MEYSILETILLCLFAGFVFRTLSVMAKYALTYGQLLGMVKVYVALNFFPEKGYILDLLRASTQSEGEEITKELYNELVPKSMIIGLLDCAYCMGFWMSLIGAVLLHKNLCLEWYSIVLIPVFTFFLTEKI